VTCSLAPVHTQRLHGRAGHTGSGLGSVSAGREETWGWRNNFWQGQLQAVETSAGREGNAKQNPAAGEILRISDTQTPSPGEMEGIYKNNPSTNMTTSNTSTVLCPHLSHELTVAEQD